MCLGSFQIYIVVPDSMTRDQLQFILVLKKLASEKWCYTRDNNIIPYSLKQYRVNLVYRGYKIDIRENNNN